jgi:hypothetical protein
MKLWKRNMSPMVMTSYLSCFNFDTISVISKMNIFFISLIPIEIAHMSCDQHVVKIQLEICQMLYTAWFFANQGDFIRENAPFTKDGKARGYRPAHMKHPMTMWVASSAENYMYACKIGIALSLEYTRRYGKVHTCAKHLLWLYDNQPHIFEERKSETAYYSKEGVPECMPEQYRQYSIVDAYQLYYMMEKMSFARYKISESIK